MGKRIGLGSLLTVVLGVGVAFGQGTGSGTGAWFDASAGATLDTMRERAVAMKVDGVAMVAYFEGQKPQAWTSRMVVVGSMRKEPTETSKGANLIGVVYGKAAEMADTLKDSGSGVRPPMNGELGYQGGVIVPYKAGYLIVAFSGGKSEEDVAISRAGVARMTGAKATSEAGGQATPGGR